MNKHVSRFVLFCFCILCLNSCNSSKPTVWPTSSSATKTALVEKIHKTAVSLYLTETAQPTRTPEPKAKSFIMPKGDFEMSWDIYSSVYNSMGGILTICRQGFKYTEKLEFPSGSNGTFDLTALSEGSEIKLTGHLGITNSLYGDYMVIDGKGWLLFYDDLGFNYSVPPIN